MFNNKGSAITIAILEGSAITIAILGLLGVGGYKGCSSMKEITGPKFQVGDCVTSSTREHWEKTELGPETFRIDEVGITKYRITWFYTGTGRSYSNESRDIYLADKYSVKIECPDELKGF